MKKPEDNVYYCLLGKGGGGQQADRISGVKGWTWGAFVSMGRVSEKGKTGGDYPQSLLFDNPGCAGQVATENWPRKKSKDFYQQQRDLIH